MVRKMAGFRAGLTAAIVAAALPAPARAQVALPGRHETWYQVRAGDFLVCSNAGASKAVEIAEQLLRFRAAISYASRLPLRTPLPITVYAFKDRSSFAPYRDLAVGRSAASVSGVFMRAPDGPLIVFDASGRWQGEHTVYHELVHSFLSGSGQRLPLWCSEGLAEFYGAFADVKGQLRFGLPLPWLGFEERRPWQPLRDVLAAGPTSPLYTDPGLAVAFYAESWMMVHYLIADAPARGGQLTRYLEQVGAGRAPADAFASAFGSSPEAFERELRAFMKEPVLRARALSAGAVGPVDAGEAAEMPRPEVLARLGYLLLRGSPNGLSAAETFLAEALHADPRSVGALTGLAAVRAAQGRPEEAWRLLRSALDEEPDDFRPYLNAAGIVLARLEEPASRSPGDADLARTLLAHAGARCPADADVWQALAHTYVVAPAADLAPGIAAAEKCLALAPDRCAPASDLVVMCVSAGLPERAREVNARFLALCADSEVAAPARHALVASDLGRAGALDLAGDAEGAFQVADRAARDARAWCVAAPLQERAAALRDGLEVELQDAALARVQALATAGDAPAALALLDELAPALRDQALRARAARLRDGLAPPRR